MLSVVYLLVSHQPHNTRWLTKPERRLAQVRLAEDAGEADEDVETDSYVIIWSFSYKFSQLIIEQRIHRPEAGSQGPQGLRLLGHGLRATARPQLRQLLPNVRSSQL